MYAPRGARVRRFAARSAIGGATRRPRDRGRTRVAVERDGSQILWANAVGAAIFGAANAPMAVGRRIESRHPASGEIVRLAATLPPAGQARLERLRGFGASFGRALTVSAHASRCRTAARSSSRQRNGPGRNCRSANASAVCSPAAIARSRRSLPMGRFYTQRKRRGAAGRCGDTAGARYPEIAGRALARGNASGADKLRSR